MATFITKVNDISLLINRSSFCHILLLVYAKPKYGQVKLFS